MTSFNRIFELLTSKLVRWGQQFVLLLPNLLIALLILGVTLFVARLLRRIINRFLPRISHHPTLN